MTDKPLAYRLAPYDPPVDMTATAHMTCAECGSVRRLKVVGIGNNPEKIEKMFIRMGWDCNVHKPKECICERCVRLRKIRIEREIDRPVPAERIFAAISKKPTPAHFPEDTPLVSGTRTSSSKEVGIKALTPEQKTSLRNELSGTFDESVGRYLDGNSDRTISEKYNIPMAVVIEFRENFYGELREDPQITAFKTQMADALKIMGNLQRTFAQMETKLDELSRKTRA